MFVPQVTSSLVVGCVLHSRSSVISAPVLQSTVSVEVEGVLLRPDMSKTMT